MDIGSLFLILGIFLLVVIYISQPLVRKNAIVVSHEDQVFSALLAERDRILNTLHELDFDHALGKIPEDIYPAEREALLQRGAMILHQIDQLKGSSNSRSPLDNLEDAVKTLQQPKKERLVQGFEDDDLEIMITNRLRAREGKSNCFCSQCGHAVQQSDSFCSKCGNILS